MAGHAAHGERGMIDWAKTITRGAGTGGQDKKGGWSTQVANGFNTQASEAHIGGCIVQTSEVALLNMPSLEVVEKFDHLGIRSSVAASEQQAYCRHTRVGVAIWQQKTGRVGTTSFSFSSRHWRCWGGYWRGWGEYPRAGAGRVGPQRR